MLRITKLLFALIVVTLSASAQEGEYISDDVIMPESYKNYLFQSISLDSVASIAASEYTTPLTYDLGEGEIVGAYKYVQKEQEYIAIKRGRGWLSALMDVYPHLLFGSGNDYELVDLNGKGSRELLIHHCENHSRGGRMGSHENSYCNYKLIDVDNGLVYDLGESFHDYSISYVGYVADDYEDSLQEEREMAEMDDEENWETTREEYSYSISVIPGIVMYEHITCTDDYDCPDSMSVIFLLQEDASLIRDNAISNQNKITR